MATPIKIPAARAADRLTKALIDFAAAGLRTNCADPELGYLWLSDHEHDRSVASVLCSGCPLELECWEAARARDERFGVWGGVDMTRHPNNKGNSSKIGRSRKTASP
jgi:Transcription factor WhiB